LPGPVLQAVATPLFGRGLPVLRCPLPDAPNLRVTR